MPRLLPPLAAASLLALVAAAPTGAAAQSFSDTQREEIGRIVRDYLIKNPEVLQEVVAEMEKRQAFAEADKHKAAIGTYREAIFNSARQVTLGNPQGDVTLVEFFDYNCGYCKRALSDTLELLKTDQKLKIVLKELPVLGPGSAEAAQVSIAVRMQDKTGKKYLDFHQKMLSGRGQADKARALAAAREAGLDVARIERDLNSDEVRQSLEESFRLAEALGLNGTPSYVIGGEVAVGAIGESALREKINIARCGKPAC